MPMKTGFSKITKRAGYVYGKSTCLQILQFYAIMEHGSRRKGGNVE